MNQGVPRYGKPQGRQRLRDVVVDVLKRERRFGAQYLVGEGGAADQHLKGAGRVDADERHEHVDVEDRLKATLGLVVGTEVGVNF